MALFPHFNQYILYISSDWSVVTNWLQIFMNRRSETYWCVSTSTNTIGGLIMFFVTSFVSRSSSSSWILRFSRWTETDTERAREWGGGRGESKRSILFLNIQCKYFHLSIPHTYSNYIYELKLPLSDKRSNLTSSIFPRIVSWKFFNITCVLKCKSSP